MWLRLARSATAPRCRYLPWSASWHPPALTRQCFADGEEKFPKLLHFCPCRSWPVGGWGEHRIWILMLRPGENREGDGLLLHVQVKTINWRKTREQAAHSCCCKLRQFPTGSHWKPAEGKYLAWRFTRQRERAKLNRTYDDYGWEGGGEDATDGCYGAREGLKSDPKFQPHRQHVD